MIKGLQTGRGDRALQEDGIDSGAQIISARMQSKMQTELQAGSLDLKKAAMLRELRF